MNYRITFNHSRRNPGWLVAMGRRLRHLPRQLSLCCFYRGLNHSWRESWDKAGRTI